MVLKKTFESPLNCKVIKPVDPKGNQPWIFFGAEAPILWPPDLIISYLKTNVGNSLLVHGLGLGAFTVMVGIQSLVGQLRSYKRCSTGEKNITVDYLTFSSFLGWNELINLRSFFFFSISTLYKLPSKHWYILSLLRDTLSA